ncbi:hypothetical protein D9M72_632790 [compost metagenome]
MSKSEIELSFKKLKIAWGSKKTRDKRRGEVQCAVWIPVEVDKQLDKLIEESGLTKQKVMETLIRQGCKNGLYGEKAPQNAVAQPATSEG